MEQVRVSKWRGKAISKPNPLCGVALPFPKTSLAMTWRRKKCHCAVRGGGSLEEAGVCSAARTQAARAGAETCVSCLALSRRCAGFRRSLGFVTVKNSHAPLQSTTDCFVLSVLASQDHSNLVIFIVLEKDKAMEPWGYPVPSLVSQSTSIPREGTGPWFGKIFTEPGIGM